MNFDEPVSMNSAIMDATVVGLRLLSTHTLADLIDIKVTSSSNKKQSLPIAWKLLDFDG